MNEKVFENYNAFYTMVQVTVGLSNSLTDEADEDQKKVIALIAEAYGVDKKVAASFEKTIIDDLASIGTESDINAFYSLCEQGKVKHEEEALLRIKCEAIRSFQMAVSRKPYGVHPEWFSFLRRTTYFPTLRFAEISAAACSGLLVCNRIAAIMSYLGIGTQKNVEGAMQRLRQCVLWGDEPSAYLLAKIYEKEGNEHAKAYADLIKIMPYLAEGYTVLPEKASKDIAEEAKQLFALIASIRQDIIRECERHEIDYSFVEIMMMESIDYYKKLEYINTYKEGKWKDASNPAKDPNKTIGFIVPEE